jgi:hypothetical protein
MANQIQHMLAVILGFASAEASIAQAQLQTTVGSTSTVHTSGSTFAEYSALHDHVGASAYANLATGKIGAGIYSYGAQAVAVSRFDERIYFQVDSDNGWVQTPITFHIALDGSHTGTTAFLQSGYAFSEIFPGGGWETKSITKIHITQANPDFVFLLVLDARTTTTSRR